MASLSERLDALEGHYQLHFAGRPRATRDVGMLDAMLEALGLAEPSAHGQRIAGLQEAWRGERQHIEAAQQQLTARGVIAARTLEQVGRACARSERLAALSPPSLWTEAELRAFDSDLDEAAARLQALSVPAEVEPMIRGEWDRQRKAVRDARERLGQHRQQRAAAAAAEAVGERAARAVRVVERLQALCRQQVEGRPPAVVRPKLLETVAEAMDEVAGELLAARPDGVPPGAHHSNCEQLVAQAHHWRAAAEEGRALRRQQSIADMAKALLDEADDVLEGSDAIGAGANGRALAARLAQRMDEVLRQLEELPFAFGLGDHAQATLGIADCLAHLDARAAHAGSPEAAPGHA